MAEVRAKKALGQHFLTDLNIARKIATSLSGGTTLACYITMRRTVYRDITAKLNAEN